MSARSSTPTKFIVIEAKSQLKRDGHLSNRSATNFNVNTSMFGRPVSDIDVADMIKTLVISNMPIYCIYVSVSNGFHMCRCHKLWTTSRSNMKTTIHLVARLDGDQEMSQEATMICYVQKNMCVTMNHWSLIPKRNVQARMSQAMVSVHLSQGAPRPRSNTSCVIPL
jgi:hypothetical protein